LKVSCDKQDLLGENHRKAKLLHAGKFKKHAEILNSTRNEMACLTTTLNNVTKNNNTIILFGSGPLSKMVMLQWCCLQDCTPRTVENYNMIKLQA